MEPISSSFFVYEVLMMEELFMCDMIANLTTMPPMPQLPEGVELKRAQAAEKRAILDYVEKNFSDAWYGEVDVALSSCPARCILAVKDEKLIGLSCWDVAAKGFFGPIGVEESLRGTGIGTALLIRTLEYMRDDGYGYAIIGWVDKAAPFYQKTIGAEFIRGGEPQNSVYSNMIQKRWLGHK